MVDSQDRSVFIVSVEVKPLPCSVMMEHDIRGGLVYCFVPANTKNEATAKVVEALEEDHYEVVHIEFVRDYGHVEWESESVGLEYDALAQEARTVGSVVYGPFYVWENE